MSEELEKEYNIENFVGKQVKIVFVDGKAMLGEIRYIKKYEIYLKSAKGNIYMIYKHAIKYITPTSDDK
ncbi:MULTISPECIES: RNA chaperone Hfq [Vagococcus]|uniref:RNA chaperone Hfq n=1 Tax=Vagococcus TaxID=2737 RepID=UPI000E4789C9|nr:MULTISPECIES: RNA chaperone Hfq [Vagococcus]RHH67538.1 hypothetical protein DW196_09475 [Vagococcus sp. AM17-17]